MRLLEIARTGLLALAIAVSIGSPVSAQGQRGTGALSLPALDRELGLRAGGFLILPTLGVNFGYDSNLFYRADNEWESPTGAQLLRVEPGVRVKNQNGQNLQLSLGGRAQFDQYLSSNEFISEQSNVGGEVALSATFFASSPVALVVEENFRRALERRAYETAKDYNRNFNLIGGGAIFRPGGGALEMRLLYHFGADIFGDTDSDWGSLIFHRFKLNGGWKFFPFTALVLDAEWQMRNYLSDMNEGFGRYGELTDSMPLRVRVGVNGFITKKLSVLLLAGYGNSLHEVRPLAVGKENPEENDSFNLPVGEIGASYKITPTMIVQGGYQFDFHDSLFSNYVQYHRMHANFLMRIAGRVDLSADLGYQYRQHAQLPAKYYVDAPAEVKAAVGGLIHGDIRNDTMLQAELKAVVDITRWLAVEAGYRLEALQPFGDDTSFGTCLDGACPPLPGGPGWIDYISYTRHSAMGTVILRY